MEDTGETEVVTLRSLRLKAGMSQRRLSVEADLTEKQVRNIEKRRQAPKGDTIDRLRRVLGPAVGQIEWTPTDTAWREERNRRRQAKKTKTKTEAQ